MSTNRRTALARAASTRAWAVGMCDNFCANMYGFTASGYADAVAHWKALPAPLRHSGDTGVPAGMLAFWGGGHGHVAISAGGGDVWSTDIAGAGTVARVSLSRIAADWGKPYLGWSVPVFQGVTWSEPMLKGLDIAGYQPVNFATAGIDFVIIKVTEGTGYTNPNWAGQRATARTAQLVPGFYHFARPGSMTAQANYFLSKIALQPGDVLAFDWEDAGVSCADKDAWIKYVKAKTGHRVLLYCNRDFWLNLDTTGYAGDGLWIADPNSTAGSPAVSAEWLMHQYSETGGYDHDVALFNSRADMTAWAEGSDMAAVDITNGAADLVASRYLAGLHDDPTTADNSTKSMGGIIWDTGKNAFWAYNATQEIKQAVTALFAKVAALDTKVTAIGTDVDSVLTKLDALSTAVTDPSGLIDSIRDELTSFKLVLQQNSGV